MPRLEKKREGFSGERGMGEEKKDVMPRLEKKREGFFGERGIEEEKRM